MKFDIRTIKFNNYKSFQDDFHSIEEIKNVNVFIGRNNSGKSSCVDIVQALLDVQKLKKINTKIRIGKDLSYDDLKSIFEFDLIPDSKAYRIDKRIDTYLGRYIEFDVSLYSDTLEFYNVSDVNAFPSNISWDKAGNNIRFLLSSMKFLRLNAERNIIPEQEDKTVSLYENGIGAVNVIHHILNYDNFDERFVREDLLLSLNEIMFPDSKFDGITVQKVAGGKWEVFLYEDGNRFPLSQMGSGLKNIILVLLNLLVMPYISTWPSFSTFEKKNLHYGNIVFAFEELENNLHPALQRRLFEYIYKFSIEHDAIIFLTTHSHVAINMFSDKEKAQLYHVNKESGKSVIHKVEDYITKCEILNDLDVKASDLLQSNGIIWVEGPSDKVYIKHWLELWGDQSLVEGVDYQFLYYGGRILSHFTADIESTNDNLISLLSTNRNSAIVIDSDICGRHTDINDTKKRIKDEFKKVDMLCWITEGKEIENYVPFQAINTAYNSSLTKQCRKNEKFTNYIKKVIGNSTFDKVGFAHKVIKYINDGNSSEILDLKSRIEELSEEIKKWNRK